MGLYKTWIPHRIPRFFSQEFISILPKIESLAMTLSLPLTVTKHECKCGVSCLAPKSRALALVLPRDGRSRGG